MAIFTKEDAAKALAVKIKEATDALTAAENLADEYGLEFSFSPAYGMGGYYTGKGKATPGIKDVTEDWDASDEDEWQSSDSYGWNPSSQSC